MADTGSYGGKGYKSNYRLAPQFRSAVVDLMESLKRIKESRDAWDNAAAYAKGLLTDRAQTTYLVAKGFRKSRSTEPAAGGSVDEIIAAVAPQRSVTMRELLELVVRHRTISMKSLQVHVGKLPGLVVERKLAPNSSRRYVDLVSNWAGAFPTDWRARAECAKNPELFFPIGATGLSAVQIERAKVVCEGCPVRPACLKTAVENGEDGVWGGFTEDERRHLPKDVQRALGEVTVNP